MKSKVLTARTPDGRSHPIVVGAGVISEVAPFLSSQLHASRVLVVTSPSVERHWRHPLERSLRDGGLSAAWAVVPDGEPAKTLAEAEGLYGAALAAGLDRRSVVVAFGGGTVGDLAGFVAATLFRGVAFVQVPTTLLAQVDAAVGGKTGVNLPEGKNLVGAFHWPAAVFADVATLATLPAAEMRAGFAEVVKYGLIEGGTFYEDLNEWAAALEGGREEPGVPDRQEMLVSVVSRSVATKLAIVESDPYESGRRRHLNLGHTAAHALEASERFGQIRHGEAVSLGLLAAGAIARAAGTGWSQGMQDELRSVLRRAGLPTTAGADAVDRLMPFLPYDKKRVDGRMRWILPKRPGTLVERDDIPQDMVREALRLAWTP